MTAWQPLRRVDNDPNYVRNPDLEELKAHTGSLSTDEIWINDLYQVGVTYLKPQDPKLPYGRDGMIHLSIHRHDRDVVANWRHMQQMKNEVAGEDRTGLEIYPTEAALVDTSNEYHIWVLPSGATLPFGFQEGLVTSDEEVEEYNEARDRGLHKGRQERWQPGLTTGRNRKNGRFDQAAKRIFERMVGKRR